MLLLVSLLDFISGVDSGHVSCRRSMIPTRCDAGKLHLFLFFFVFLFLLSLRSAEPAGAEEDVPYASLRRRKAQVQACPWFPSVPSIPSVAPVR